jgi:hypothetical protein
MLPDRRRAPRWSKAMSDGTAYEVSRAGDEEPSSRVEVPRRPDPAAVLAALAALEAEFNAILKRGAPASE